VIEDGARIGGHATILPGVRIGAEAFVAAGCLVSKDVPARMMAIGVPMRIEPLPKQLEPPNDQQVLTGPDIWYPQECSGWRGQVG